MCRFFGRFWLLRGSRTFGDHPKQRIDPDSRIDIHDDFLKGSSDRRINFEGHFVRFQFNQRLVKTDSIADALHPARYSCLGHRFAQNRDLDFRRHFLSIPLSVHRNRRVM